MYNNIKDIVMQLEKCKYTDEHGHPLENNVAFISLKGFNDPITKEEYFVTFKKQLPGVAITGKAIWERKYLESKMAYADDIEVIDIKKL